MPGSNREWYERTAAATRARVRAACEELIGRGVHPSLYQLMPLLPGLGLHAIATQRRRLIAAGELAIPRWEMWTRRGRAPRGPRTPTGPGLTGATAAERAEIEARIAMVRAGKPDPENPPWHVPRSRGSHP